MRAITWAGSCLAYPGIHSHRRSSKRSMVQVCHLATGCYPVLPAGACEALPFLSPAAYSSLPLEIADMQWLAERKPLAAAGPGGLPPWERFSENTDTCKAVLLLRSNGDHGLKVQRVCLLPLHRSPFQPCHICACALQRAAQAAAWGHETLQGCPPACQCAWDRLCPYAPCCGCSVCLAPTPG